MSASKATGDQSHSHWEYRRASIDPHGDVVLKMSSNGGVARLRNEWTTTRSLVGVDGVHVPLDAVDFEGSYALAFPPDYPPSGMADDALVSLADYLSATSFLDINQGFALLCQLATVLGRIHKHGIVYCNVSLDTVWLHFTSSTARATHNWSNLRISLSDFSFARKAGDAVLMDSLCLDVCGDVRFMSPESTGRTNRPVDTRSDIYGLGMLMHCAVTGEMPKTGMSVLQTVHSCITSTPAPLITLDSPDAKLSPAQAKAVAFQRMLDGMLSKLPEHRFRTCADILHSLDMIGTYAGHLHDFTPRLSSDRESILHQLLSATKLYGRQAELDQLQAFQRTVYYAEKGGLAIVRGPSGVGKTTLVQELMAPACQKHGLFCSGKQDQYKTDAPYLAIVQAFTDMISLLLTDDMVIITMISKDIRRQLGENVQLVLDVLPNLRFLLVAGNAAEGLAPQAQSAATVSTVENPDRVLKRLKRALVDILRCVTAYRPLTLLLDDIQWADKNSADLLSELVAQSIPRRLLLVVTVRTDPDTSLTRLDSFKDALSTRRKDLLLCELELGNLSRQVTEQWLSDLLGPPSSSAPPDALHALASVAYERTLGNILHLRHLLQLLLERSTIQLVCTGTSDQQWTWDPEAARELPPFSNAVDMLSSRLKALPPATQRVLITGALLGSSFSSTELSHLLHIAASAVPVTLQSAVDSGYLRIVGWRDAVEEATEPFDSASDALRLLDDAQLVPHGIGYKLTNVSLPLRRKLQNTDSAINIDTPATSAALASVRYQWTHDRLRQAAASLLDGQDEKEAAQLSVGCWLLECVLQCDTERIFDAVQLLMSARAKLTTTQDRINVVKLCIVACSEARTRSAFDSALKYAQHAIDLLDPSAWRTHYDTAFRAYYNLIATEHDNGLLQDMGQHISTAEMHASSDLDRAALMELRILQLLSQFKPQEAFDREDAHALARALPTDLPTIRQIKDRASTGDLRTQAATRVVTSMLSSAWRFAPALFESLAILGATTALESGYNENCQILFVWYVGSVVLGDKWKELMPAGSLSVILKSILNNAEVCFAYAQLAMDMTMERRIAHAICPVIMVYSVQAQCWMMPMATAAATIDRGLQAGIAYMNYEHILPMMGTLLDVKLMAGERLPTLLSYTEQWDPTAAEMQGNLNGLYYQSMRALVKHLVRPRATPVSDYMLAGGKAMPTFPGNVFQEFMCVVAALLLHLLSGDIGSALASVKSGEKYLLPQFLTTIQCSVYYFYRGLTYAWHLMQSAQDVDASMLQSLRSVIALHEPWAARCPSTFGCRLHLLQGCELWLQDRVTEAVTHLERAIGLTQQHGLVYMEALANETVGRLLSNLQHCPKLAVAYFRASQSAYRRWGAEWKARTFDASADTQSLEPAAAPQNKGDVAADAVDLETLHHWTLSIASETSQAGLVVKFMDLALMHSGSREGYLLWLPDERPDATEEVTFSSLQCLAASSVGTGTEITTRQHPGASCPADLAPLVNYVLRTREVLTESSPLVATLQRHPTSSCSTGSLLLLPIITRDRCVGALYLANKVASSIPAPQHSSSSKRSVMMRLLTAQLVVALENTHLLDQLRASNKALQSETVKLEERVEQRTKELADTNAHLQQMISACQDAEALARQAAEANRTFLHHMSHELRTPLNAVIGTVDLLLSDGSLTAEQRDVTETLKSSSHELLQIVNDVLDLGKIQAGKMTLVMQPCCLRNIAECALESVALQAARKKLTLVLHYPGTVPQTVFSDGTRIGQVMRNLLSNAVKFTEVGRIVMGVKAAPDDTARPLADAPPPNHQWHVFTAHCTDSGIGIPEEETRLLFKEFSQLDSSSTRKHSGTGLGLNISKGIAGLLNGDLTCSSQVGRGSTFTFTFGCDAKPVPTTPILLPSTLRFVVLHPLAEVQEMVCGYMTFPGDPADVCVVPKDAETFAGSVDLSSSLEYIIITGEEPIPSALEPHPRIVLSRDSTMTSRDTDRLCHATTTQRSQFNLRVLVAEDNEVSRKLAGKLLLRLGIKARLAEDGRIAVQATQEQDFDLFLADVQLDGVGATAQIREAQSSRQDLRTKIIAVSANAFAEDKQKYLAAGMDDLLPKPIQLDALETYIQGLGGAVALYNVISSSAMLHGQPGQVRTRALFTAAVVQLINAGAACNLAIHPLAGFDPNAYILVCLCPWIAVGITVTAAVQRYCAVMVTHNLKRLVFHAAIALNITASIIAVVVQIVAAYGSRPDLWSWMSALIYVHPLQIIVGGLFFFTFVMYRHVAKQQTMAASHVAASRHGTDHENSVATTSASRVKGAPTTATSTTMSTAHKLSIVMQVNLTLTMLCVVLYIVTCYVSTSPRVDPMVGTAVLALASHLILFVELMVASVGKMLMDHGAAKAAAGDEAMKRRSTTSGKAPAPAAVLKTSEQ
ncbi:hypothetical protein RI367_000501 [Sorochytrium milnesiophthora]